MSLKNLNNKIDAGSLWKRISGSLLRREPFVMAGISLLLIGISGYLWYRYNYDYHWSDPKIEEYSRNRRSGVEFEKGKCEEVLADIISREEKFKEELNVESDIFRINK